MEEYGISRWISVAFLLTFWLWMEIPESVIERPTTASLGCLTDAYRVLVNVPSWADATGASDKISAKESLTS